jgi:hypothetical protein
LAYLFFPVNFIFPVVLTARTLVGDFTEDAVAPPLKSSFLATFAFLVVFRVLIKLFFSMAIMVHALLAEICSSPDRAGVQVVCQTGKNRY